SAYRETTRRGARGVMEPAVFKDEWGEVRKSAIAIYGDTIHTFVERKDYRGAFLPGFRAVEGPDPVSRPVGLKFVDHCVGNVELGAMNRWVEFYMNVMGFRMFKHFDDADISTEYSALMSKIEEYHEYYRSPGVQHIAMATDDILDTVGKLRDHGIEFLRVPSTYYD